MKVVLSTGRLSYEPKSGYQDGVLIGTNWVEDRLHYVPEKHNHNSLYRTDFVPQERTRDTTEVWNNIITGEGIDRAILMDHEGKNYYENYSSLCDLSYHWLPLCNRPTRKYRTMVQKYVPEQDFALNYGNITNFGLRKQKNTQWAYENLTGSTSWTTEVRDNYLKPDPKSYTTERRATSKMLSSKLSDVNKDFVNLPLRGERISLTPEIPIEFKKRPYPHFYY